MKEITRTRRYELAWCVDGDFPLGVQLTDMPCDHALHSHDFVEIALVESGSAVHTTRNTRRPVSTGDVVVIPKGVRHGYEEVRNFMLKNVTFDLSLLDSVHSDLRHLPGFHALFLLPRGDRASSPHYEFSALEPGEMAYLGRLVGKMKDELSAKAPGYKTVCLAALLELAAFLSRKEFGKDSGGEHNLDKVLGHMERSHGRKITVKELAKIAGCSERSFHRIFHKTTGKSPVDYLLGIRLSRSKRLLAGTAMSVAAIAEETGFMDGAYFAKQFKRGFGMSPTEFRKLLEG